MPRIEVVKTPKVRRDSRTHQERMLALKETFGELKSRALQLGKVNECSLTKVAEKAGVPKVYLTGNKEFKESGVAERYRAIGENIVEFREEFQAGKLYSEEQKLIKELKAELRKVKASVYPYFVELENIKHGIEYDKRALNEANERIVFLQAKVSEMGEQVDIAASHGNIVNAFPESMVRTVISPDKHLIVDGEYRYTDEELRHKAWLKAYDELEAALSRSYAKRLYVLVGLPCSGKTTWAENATLYSDRHPIIFDSTCLRRFEREDLTHRIKRFSDLKFCCVYFDTPMTVIRGRNNKNRMRDKQISDEELDLLNAKLQQPDPYVETCQHYESQRLEE